MMLTKSIPGHSCTVQKSRQIAVQASPASWPVVVTVVAPAPFTDKRRGKRINQYPFAAAAAGAAVAAAFGAAALVSTFLAAVAITNVCFAEAEPLSRSVLYAKLCAFARRLKGLRRASPVITTRFSATD